MYAVLSHNPIRKLGKSVAKLVSLTKVCELQLCMLLRNWDLVAKFGGCPEGDHNRKR